jgi:hypothetical protein
MLLTLDRGRRWPGECALPAQRGEKTPVEGNILAVVPARDEAALLPATLPSLLSQKIVSFRVILVDDGSTDGTAEVARAVSRETGHAERLEVITAPPTPPGWSGKVWALAQGVSEGARGSAAQADPEWLLFTDADISHRPGSVGALLEVAAGGSGSDPFDLVSVMARLRAETFWERLLIPPFVFFFQLLYPFPRVQDPDSEVAAAAGGCVLAKQIKRAGGRLWLGFDPGIRSLRPYDRLGQIWRMVARSAFDQLHYRYGLLFLVLLGLLILVASPPVLALAGALKTVSGTASASAGRALMWAVLAWGLEALALLPWVRHHRVPAIYAHGLPLAAVFYGLMTAGSAWSHLTGRGTRWKGRSTS